MKNNNPIMIVGVFFALFFMFADLGVNVAYGVALLTLMLVMVVVRNNYVRFYVTKDYVLLLATAIVVVVNLRNFEFVRSNPFYIFAMILTLIVLPFSSGDEKSKNRLLSMMLCVVSVVATIPIISMIFPDFYSEKILTLLSPEAQSYNLDLMKYGYSGVVGAYVSLTANYVVIGVAVSVSRYGRGKVKYFLLTIYFILALLCINRRSEVVACCFSLVLVLFLKLKKEHKAIALGLFIFLVVLCMVIISLLKSKLWTYNGSNRLLLSLSDLLYNKDISNGRNSLYKVAWDLFCEHPLFGVGFGRFRNEGSRILSNVTNVHNIYLQLLCEVGVVGSIVIYFALFILLKRAYSVFSIENKKGVEQSTGCFAFFMVVYVLTVGIFDNPIFQDTFWLLLSVILFCIKKNKYAAEDK